MQDIAAKTTTQSTVSVGSTVNSLIDFDGDHDWFWIDLVAGQAIKISLNGAGATPLGDPYLRVRDSATKVIASSDDDGPGSNSLLIFTAATTGRYYIDVSAFGSGVGEYSLGVAPAPPIATVSQFAYQLSHGYHGGIGYHFNVTQGGSLSVNLTGLTADGQNLARLALTQWSDVIGVRFTEVASGGQIIFDDNQAGAFSNSRVSGNIITSSTVNISTQWLSAEGRTVGTYGFQTYIHEIGHALGLGHAGNYNGEGTTYTEHALFRNDAWSMSVMSYFSQFGNTYFRDLGFTHSYVGTPMIADIAAMGTLYGLSTTTRLGATTYGFNSNAGDIYNANLYTAIAYTVFDSGGLDKLDYSGFSQNQLIDLNPGQFSNIGGRIGNVTIAIGTVIEDAVGGSGDDVIRGNASNNMLIGRGGHDQLFGGGGDDLLSGQDGNDILSGGSGNDVLAGGAGFDTFWGTKAELNGDLITDFAKGDRIIFSDAHPASGSEGGFFSYSFIAKSLTFTGGSLSFHSAPVGRIIESTSTGGDAILTLLSLAPNDFNGDGHSDILWRHSDGTVTNWLGEANGGFAFNHADVLSPSSNEWRIAGTGDFNGDGRSDILWRHADGTVTNWLGQANGTFASNHTNTLSPSSNDWQIAGTGDFNGDGRSDILWRHTDGTVTNWLGQANGSFSSNHANVLSPSSNEWRIAQSGDFNGDGRSDILWRHADGTVTNWLGQANGSFTANHTNTLSPSSNDWQIAGSGDFNGDGRDDILWRHTDGTVTDWLGQADGSFAGNHTNAYSPTSNDWQIAGIGDFNGDGRSDILWRHTDGSVTNWLGQADGSFAGNHANAYYLSTTDWKIEPSDILV